MKAQPAQGATLKELLLSDQARTDRLVKRPVKPTHPEDELAQGRMALWLSPGQIAFIADEWRKIPEDAAPQIRQSWAAIAFRAMAALHKAGVKYDPSFPAGGEAYCLARRQGGPQH